MEALRFGILSTARVNDYSFLPVIKKVDGAELTAIASRDSAGAGAYAAKHMIPKSYGNYDSLLADSQIDCVYIPLPVSMHAEWSVKALDAGKHVLCEKPIASNESEALAIAEKADASGLTFAEAFHYIYHPVMTRTLEIVRSGGIGHIKRISAMHGVPHFDTDRVQFKPELAGGALRDIGCYPVHFARSVAGCNDARVLKATAEMTRSGVDGTMRATIEFTNGIRAEVIGSLAKYYPMSASVMGDKGSIHLLSPFNPAIGIGPFHMDVYLMIKRSKNGMRSIRVPTVTSYQCQLEAFCEAVRTGGRLPTTARDGAANMRIIDAIYRKAGIRTIRAAVH